MFQVKLHNRINQITSCFFRMGLWHREVEATVTQTLIKWFYPIYFIFFPISLFASAASNNNKNENVFSIIIGAATCVLFLKVLQVVRKKEQIIEFLNTICVYSIEDHRVFSVINRRLEHFIKFATIFIVLSCLTCIFCVMEAPLIESERRFFLQFAFPFDWENNDFAYALANVFFFTELSICCIGLLYSVIIWYLLFNCASRYEILGHKIKGIGTRKDVKEIASKRKLLKKIASKRKILKIPKENSFLRDLIAVIKLHQFIKE